MAIVAYSCDVVATGVKLLDAGVVIIGYKKIPTVIDGDADGAVEFIVAKTIVGRRCAQVQDEVSIGVKLLDAVVITVCHIYLATSIDCDTVWEVETPVGTAALGGRCANGHEEVSTGVKLLDTVDIRVCNPNVATVIDCNASRVLK